MEINIKVSTTWHCHFLKLKCQLDKERWDIGHISLKLSGNNVGCPSEFFKN